MIKGTIVRYNTRYWVVESMPDSRFVEIWRNGKKALAPINAIKVVDRA